MSPAPHETSPPVLGYATPQADGTPDFINAAEETIETGGSPNDIRGFFRRSEDALRYYCKSQERRFSIVATQASDRCSSCGISQASGMMLIRWRATVLLRTTEFRVSSSDTTRDFTTRHRICPACYQHHYRQIQRRRWIDIASNIVVVLGAVALITSDRWGRALQIRNREDVAACILLGAVLFRVITMIVTMMMRGREAPFVRRSVSSSVKLLRMSKLFEIVFKYRV